MTTILNLSENARLRRAGGVAFPQGNATASCIPPPKSSPLCGGSLRFAQVAANAAKADTMRFQIVGVKCGALFPAQFL